MGKLRNSKRVDNSNVTTQSIINLTTPIDESW